MSHFVEGYIFDFFVAACMYPVRDLFVASLRRGVSSLRRGVTFSLQKWTRDFVCFAF
jgi:hypothetical protein